LCSQLTWNNGLGFHPRTRFWIRSRSPSK
jgi:hypothetical protein